MSPLELAPTITSVVALVVLLVMFVVLRKDIKQERERQAEFIDGELKKLAAETRKAIALTPQPKLEVKDDRSTEELKMWIADLRAELEKISMRLNETSNHSDHSTALEKSMGELERKLIEILAADKFIALLDDSTERKKAVVAAIRRLGDDVAGRLAVAYPSDGATSILQDIAITGHGSESVAWALMGVADKHIESGQLESAERFYKQALSAFENSVGPQHIDVAGALESLAKVAIAQGRTVEAEGLLNRSSGIRGNQQADDFKSAESNIQLADLYVEQDRLQEARMIYERTHEVLQQSFGPSHEQCINVLKKLGAVHETLEDPAEAARVYEKITELQVGPELQSTLRHLIPMYESTSNWSALATIYRRLIKLSDDIEPLDELQKADYLRSLARTLKRQDKKEEAIELLKQALTHTEDLLGAGHGDVSSIIDELTDYLMESERLVEAAPYVMRAFRNSLTDTESDRFRRILGRIKNLAESLILVKEFDVAEDMYQQSLASMEKLQNPPRKAIIGLLRKIGSLCAQLEDYEKSEAALRRAVRITEILFGDDHAETLAMLMQLAHLLQKGEKFQESEAIYKRVLEMRYKIHGEQHPDIVESLVELAKLCRLQNNAIEAEIYQESAVEMARKIYGNDAPQVIEIAEAFGGGIESGAYTN